MANIWSELFSFGLNNPVVRSLLTAIVRSVVGWLENSVKDGNFKFEVNKLVETFLRILPQALGLSAAGLPAEAALITDWAGVKLVKSKK